MAVGQAGAAAHEAAVQAVQAAFTELLLLQYCAEPYAAPEQEEIGWAPPKPKKNPDCVDGA